MKLSNISKSISNKISRNISHKSHEAPTSVLNTGITSNWILALGSWNDSGLWDDSQNWMDS